MGQESVPPHGSWECFGSVERDSFLMLSITGTVRFTVVLGHEWVLHLFKIQNIDDVDSYLLSRLGSKCYRTV